MTLHKMMGYGLVDVQLNERDKITDPRINASSILLDYEREEEATVRNYVSSTLESDERLEAVLQGWHWGHMDPESTDPFDAVNLLSETSVPNTLILRSVGDRDWHRRGSLLDSYVEQEHNAKEQDHVSFLRGGIHPYSNRFMDVTTHEVVDWYAIGDWVRAVNDNKPSERLEMAAFYALEKLGWGDIGHEALKKRIAPMPPQEIIDLAKFGKLFTTPETVFELRPMIATFWR